MKNTISKTVRIDMETWGLGDWPERLLACIDTSTRIPPNDSDDEPFVVSIGLKVEPSVEEIVKKIAKEAVEAFFVEGGTVLHAELTVDGDLEFYLYNEDFDYTDDGRIELTKTSLFGLIEEWDHSNEYLKKLRGQLNRIIERIDAKLAVEG